MSIYKNFNQQLNLLSKDYSKPKRIVEFPEIPPIKSIEQVKKILFPLLAENYLSHGSYGSCPLPILLYYQSIQLSLESNPTDFYHNKLFDLLAYSIRILAEYLCVNPARLVLVKNVEVAITSVLTQYSHTIMFDITYKAVQNSASKHCTTTIIPLSRPITTESILQDFEKFLQTYESGGLFLLEHITSPTAILMPVSRLISIAKKNNLMVMVDGAHSIGQLDVDLEGLDCDYYTSNLHKWLCSPRGVAYLYVKDKVKDPMPSVTTWGWEYGMQGRFVWQGTDDYSGFLSIPFVIEFFRKLDDLEIFNNVDSPLEGYKNRNMELCRYGKELLLKEWGTDSLVDQVECAMCAIRVPNVFGSSRQPTAEELAKLKEFVQVPNFLFDGVRYIRISCHIYNTRKDLQVLSRVMLDLCMELGSSET